MNDAGLIVEKLDMIIKLLAINQIKGKEIGEQIVFLNGFGIANKDIASILGKSQNTVNATLSQHRRKKDDKKE